ncbi:uncharacterized protein FOMMEDRAFT_148678 [Fomitiporia mediterranea MF3/22]|uniref:uncharacterized protein n=1 Tax=Fomitiporia mediterranea (strain MF3/22) TaxID=694068 RepID=UPI0004407E96|nr:uncharacterized protein FOMMEDRAFT_148678 [Fomitiporia mediterranea MF3/22]EJC99455.1 hypothetical protein FOMMEDRAFT_148678 [Fomitiporia mediterranea MF3/22]
MTTVILACSAQHDSSFRTTIDLDVSHARKESSDGVTFNPAGTCALNDTVSNYRSEQFSSSPSTSRRDFTSPRTTLDTDTFTQDSEPAPYSSTPDLGSQDLSSPSTDFDSQVIVTPPEKKFIRILEQKLQALVNSKRNRDKSPHESAEDSAEDNEAEKPLATGSDIGQAAELDLTPSTTQSTKSEGSLKRKRLDTCSRDTSVGTEASTDEDTDVEDEDKLTDLAVPVSKKLKETSFNYAATETASARRARSLSVCSSHASLIPTEVASPSRPSTPVSKVEAVPIIAPPGFDAIPRPPLSPDDAAEARLKILLHKEWLLRRHHGFEKGINDIFGTSITKDQVDDFLGIDEEFRKEIIAWMLRVTPSKKLGVGELRNQLRTCPETRFHAVLLFTRYFMRVGDAMPVPTEKETPLMRLGRRRIVWDVAISCLAIAIKYNRDFLSPFSPVYAREFLVLAPHPMSHDDFEISQKDVLQALEYEIRDVTPGPFMQEIWASLSSFRKLLSFSDGWEITQMNAWHILNASMTASEMLQFPISLLTAGALVEGAVVALIDLYEQDADSLNSENSSRNEAESVIDDIVKDINELMGVPSVDMKRCRRWLQKVISAAY